MTNHKTNMTNHINALREINKTIFNVDKKSYIDDAINAIEKVVEKVNEIDTQNPMDIIYNILLDAEKKEFKNLYYVIETNNDIYAIRSIGDLKVHLNSANMSIDNESDMETISYKLMRHIRKNNEYMTKVCIYESVKDIINHI